MYPSRRGRQLILIVRRWVEIYGSSKLGAKEVESEKRRSKIRHCFPTTGMLPQAQRFQSFRFSFKFTAPGLGFFVYPTVSHLESSTTTSSETYCRGWILTQSLSRSMIFCTWPRKFYILQDCYKTNYTLCYRMLGVKK